MFTVARKSKLVLTICLTLGILFLSVTGCSVISQIESGLRISSPSETPTPGNETPIQINQENTQTQEPTKTIILWVPPQLSPNGENPAGIMLENRLKDFETLHPGFKVELRVKSLNGESSLLNSLSVTAAAAPDALPGLILLNRTDMEIAALKSLIFPIPSRAAEYNSPDWFSLTLAMASTQGVQYGLPLFIDPFVMAYNKKEIAFPPTTWQELAGQHSAVAINLEDPLALFPLSVYSSFGGILTDENGMPILNADPLTRTYQLIFTGADSNAFPAWLVNLHSTKDTFAALEQGRSSYALVWASQVMQSADENISLAPLPGNPNFPAGFADGWMLCITNPNAELSSMDILLADFLLQPEFLVNWSETAGYIPAQKSVLENWQNKINIDLLEKAVDQSQIIPGITIQQATAEILNKSTTSLIRKQTSYMQAVLDTLSALEVK